MKTKLLIDRIKAQCATFSSRVAGTAEFENSIENTDLAVPCAFVMRLGSTPAESTTANVVVQDVERRFAVIVVVSNTTDQRGFAAGESVDDIETELFDALLGWAPNTEHTPMESRGDRLLFSDRARLIHQFDFSTQTVIGNL